MIKTKTEYKTIGGLDLGRKLSVMAFDGWMLAAPIYKTTLDSQNALIVREVKVTRDNLFELLYEDYRLEVGGVKYKDGYQMETFMASEKVNKFITASAKRYEVKASVITEVLVDNINELSWCEDKDDEDDD